jgi:hypothetical protein
MFAVGVSQQQTPLCSRAQPVFAEGERREAKLYMFAVGVSQQQTPLCS